MPSWKERAAIGLWPKFPRPAARGFTTIPFVSVRKNSDAGWPPGSQGAEPLPESWRNFAYQFMRSWRDLATHRATLGITPRWPWINLSALPQPETGIVQLAMNDYVDSWNEHVSGVV